MSNQKIKAGDISGDALGVGAKGVIAKEVHGNIIQIIYKSGVIEEQLGKIAQIPTEVNQNKMAGVDGNVLPKDAEQLHDSVSELLKLLKSSGLSDRQNNEIRAGNHQISKVELLLKKAILVKTEADQMVFDYTKRTNTSTNKLSGNEERSFISGSKLFVEGKHKAKLQEAYDLLEEANELEPANTEVLLHMAQLLIELTPDDTSDEQKLLFRIQRLLNNPKDDVERFRLAQTTFLLSTTGSQLDERLLKDARNMFERLGRTEWVRQCDEMLGSSNQQEDKNNNQFDFYPVGIWYVKTSDFVGSTMQMTLHANGYFEATQQAGMYGNVAYATGQWVFNPQQRMLHFQGAVNNFYPFMLGIMVQYQQGQVFYGVGTDGYSYVLQKNL